MTCVVVLGPPRSGTSAVAGVLHRLGITMFPANNSIGLTKDRKNQKGYFEDLRFNEYHQRMMGGNLFNPERQFDQADMVGYKALVKSRMSQPLWGIKDPRLCFTFPVLYEHIGHDMLLVLTKRPRTSIVKSMFNFSQMTQERARHIVNVYLLARGQSLVETRYKGPRLVVDYNVLLNDAEAQVGRLAEFAGVGVHNDAIAFLDKGLRHY